MDSVSGNLKREENEKRSRLFAELAAVEKRVLQGSSASGSSREATEALIQANVLLDSDFVISDIKSANRELDFCENALASCSDGVGGVISLRDIVMAYNEAFLESGNANGEPDLKRFCMKWAACYRACPLWASLKNSIESVSQRREQVDGTQSQKRKRSMLPSLREDLAEREADRTAEEAVDSERAAADERDVETMKEINRVRKEILDAIFLGGNGPISYWQFVFDKNSKGKTFMNMLHVNHILINQKKEICLVKGKREGELYLTKTTNLKSHDAANKKVTFTFTLTDELYASLKETYCEV